MHAHTFAPGCVLYAAPEVRQVTSASNQTEKIDVYSYAWGMLYIAIHAYTIAVYMHVNWIV